MFSLSVTARREGFRVRTSGDPVRTPLAVIDKTKLLSTLTRRFIHVMVFDNSCDHFHKIMGRKSFPPRIYLIASSLCPRFSQSCPSKSGDAIRLNRASYEPANENQTGSLIVSTIFFKLVTSLQSSVVSRQSALDGNQTKTNPSC